MTDLDVFVTNIRNSSYVTNITVDVFEIVDRNANNLCNPFKYDLRCALFSLLSFVKTNLTPQGEREAKRRPYLKGLHRLHGCSCSRWSSNMSAGGNCRFMFDVRFSIVVEFSAVIANFLCKIFYKI